MDMTISPKPDPLKGRIATYWNGRAGQYDGQFGHGIFTDDEKQAWLRALGENLRQPQGARVLDVGCGTGFLSLLLAELGFAVTGVDLSEEMMGEGRRKAEARGLGIIFLHGDAESPPVSAGVFQAVISRHLLWTLPNPKTALNNWKNLLAPGGQVIVIDGVWTPRSPMARVMYFLAATVGRLKGKKETKGWEREYLENPSELPLMGGAEPEQVIDLFNAVGFERVGIDPLAEVLRCEKSIAPLEHRLRYTLGKTRYLVSGFSPSRSESGATN